MRKYLYQRFLPNCNTNDFELDDYICAGEDEACGVPISQLDEQIDSEEDLRDFLSHFSQYDTIVLIYDRPNYNNPIIRDYAIKTFKSYLFWIRHFGYKCLWKYQNTISKN